MSLEKYMPPSERLEVSTVYSMDPLSSSLRSLTGTLRLKRGVDLSLVYMNPPVKQRLNTEGGIQIAPFASADLSHRAHCEEAAHKPNRGESDDRGGITEHGENWAGFILAQLDGIAVCFETRATNWSNLESSSFKMGESLDFL
jgi:hypothetical protein